MYMAYIGTKLSTTIDISLRLGKGKTLSFLLAAVLIVFAWQQFTALLIGGAFFRVMAESPPRIWTGVIVFFSFPAAVQITFDLRISSVLGFVAQSFKRESFKRETRILERYDEEAGLGDSLPATRITQGASPGFFDFPRANRVPQRASPRFSESEEG
jgi:hypothetical protein